MQTPTQFVYLCEAFPSSSFHVWSVFVHVPKHFRTGNCKETLSSNCGLSLCGENVWSIMNSSVLSNMFHLVFVLQIAPMVIKNLKGFPKQTIMPIRWAHTVCGGQVKERGENSRFIDSTSLVPGPLCTWDNLCRCLMNNVMLPFLLITIFPFYR